MIRTKNIIGLIALLMALLFIIVLIAYIKTFSGEISNNVIYWDLFISICNWLCISILTMINIVVFYKLTTTIAKKDATRFIENKITQTENSLRELRIEYYQHLQNKGIDLIMKISSNKEYTKDFEDFYKQLLSMQSSILFSCSDKIKNSTIDSILELYINVMTNKDASNDDKKECILRCLRGIEIIILSIPLRDNRILNSIKENSEQFDPVFISIDNFMSKLS